MPVRSWRFLSALSILVSTAGVPVASQTGVGEIQQLAGCFEVTYHFVEDGTEDVFSERYPLKNPSTEWVGLKRNADGTLVLEHVLFAGPTSFPHWHEVWTWKPEGQAWTQEIRGGAARPTSPLRYQCTAPWMGNRWECHAGKAEKPLRDEKRDYDFLDRRNTLLVTPKGWVHNEHNNKMRSSGQIVARELGWITYRRLPEDRCGTIPRQFPVDVVPPESR